MTAMYSNLKNNNDVRVDEMRTLFHLPSAEAKEALSSISSNAAAKNMAAVQRSNVTQHLLSARLNEAFTTKPVKVKIPVQHLRSVTRDFFQRVRQKYGGCAAQQRDAASFVRAAERSVHNKTGEGEDPGAAFGR